MARSIADLSGSTAVVERPEYYGNPAGLTEDLEAVRAVYAAFADRDIERALEHVAPDCEIHLEATARSAGRTEPYRGHAGMREYFADVGQVWDELSVRAEDFRVVPGSVIVLGSVTGRRNGEEIRRAVVWTWRLREGRATFIRVSDMGPART
jgi:ketosteroid isomerase-like protein